MSSVTAAQTPLPDSVDVLIVGGGPVGSTLALNLAWHGISVLLAERDPVIYPDVRARGISSRSLELFRKLGVADDLRAADDIPRDWYRATVVTDSLASEPLQVLPANPGEMGIPFEDGQRPPDFIAELPMILPQPKTVAILRKHAAAHGAHLATGWEVVRITQSPDTVTATLRETASGRQHTLTAAYAVGAEGARSLVRDVAGIRLKTAPPRGKRVSVTFQADDLHTRLGIERHAWYRIPRLGNGPGITSHARDRWGFGLGPFPLDADLSSIDVEAEAKRLVGADVPLHIDQTRVWIVQSTIAETYRAGRLFLAGDAAHTCPPTGGQNMNTGIGDAGNLAWKLAAVLHGWAGDGLLDTYSEERQPIGARNTKWSLDYAQTGTADPEPASAPGERPGAFSIKGVVLDQRYESAAIIDDGTDLPDWQPGAYVISAKPGLRAPHAWVDARTSLYDLFGRGFTLLDFGNDPTAGDAFAAAADLPLTIVRPGCPDIAALYQTRYALIRPDQHIAWRGDVLPDHPADILDIVRGRRPAAAVQLNAAE